MPRFPRRRAAAVLSLALALPFLGWIGDRVGDLWQALVAGPVASESGDPATAPEPGSPRAITPESPDSSSAGPEEDDTGKLDPNG